MGSHAVLGVADGYAECRRAFQAGLMPERNLRLSEWAEEFRILPSKSASEPGPWRNDRTPYLVEIMDCLSSSHPAEEVVVIAGTQIGKTEAGNNWIGYVIDHAPAPMMVIMPTLNLAKRFSKHRLTSMIDEMPTLRAKVAEKRTRDASNTTLMKDFPRGMLVIAGANSAADLRSMPCKYIFADEIDGYPFDLDGEGDPLALAAKRSTNFPRRKIFKTSTPTTKGFSRIEAAYQATDRRRYFVPCPDCNERQVLKWANVKWKSAPDHQPDTAHYLCEHCGTVIEEHHKTWMLKHGVWIAEAPNDGRRRGYKLPTLYSPLGWESWPSLVRQFLEAKRALDAGDDTKMKTFVNTCLAETWEEQGDQVRVEGLAERAAKSSDELGSVPIGGLLLTGAVDVQGNRLEYKIKAWGRGEESWLVDYGAIYGDPAQVGEGSVWETLKQRVTTPWTHASGAELRVLAMAVDSGGHHTHEVYQFCRQNRHLRFFAVKGASQPGRPVLGKPSVQDVNFRGEKIKRGVQLWPVGTDTAKGLIYGRLKVSEPGAGHMHFPKDLPSEYFEQLTAERLVTRYVKGRPRLEWVKPAGKRNEALDLEVYAYAAACFLGVNRYRIPDWDRLERQIQPAQMDLLDATTGVQRPGLPDKANATSVKTGNERRAVKSPASKTGGNFATDF